MILRSKSDKETRNIAYNLGKKRKKGLICLYGDLGAGKTTFIRGFAKGMGIKETIQSPTFTYHRTYKSRKNLYHFDFYRIKKFDALLMNELFEALERNDGVIAVEWAEKISEFLPRKRTDIYLDYIDNATRKIKISRKI